MTIRLPLACAVALLVPLGIAAAGVVLVAAGERAGLTPFGGLMPRNSAEAAGIGSAAQVLRLLRMGDDLHRVHPVDPAVISSAVLWATTLEAAVWSRQVELFQALDREGVIRAADRLEVACLAADLRVEDVVEYLAPDGAEHCEPGKAFERVLARTTAQGS